MSRRETVSLDAPIHITIAPEDVGQLDTCVGPAIDRPTNFQELFGILIDRLSKLGVGISEAQYDSFSFSVGMDFGDDNDTSIQLGVKENPANRRDGYCLHLWFAGRNVPEALSGNRREILFKSADEFGALPQLNESDAFLEFVNSASH